LEGAVHLSQTDLQENKDTAWGTTVKVGFLYTLFSLDMKSTATHVLWDHSNMYSLVLEEEYYFDSGREYSSFRNEGDTSTILYGHRVDLPLKWVQFRAEYESVPEKGYQFAKAQASYKLDREGTFFISSIVERFSNSDMRLYLVMTKKGLF